MNKYLTIQPLLIFKTIDYQHDIKIYKTLTYFN